MKFGKYNNILKSALFVVIFALFATCYYPSVLTQGPLNTHRWRQTDCLALANGYYDGASFLHPQMNILLADDFTTGKTAGEFPILYYIIGKTWQVTGISYFVYRLFYLLILFAAMFAFYKSLLLLFKDNFWAIVLAALLFTSPVLVVYGVSFLTDVPAFCFILIALYFFLRYYHNKSPGFLVMSMAFFALAGLVKTSSLIAFVFLWGILFLETFKMKSLGDKKVFNLRVREWAAFIAAVAAIVAWYWYAYHYTFIHNRFKYTFNDIYPIWIMKSGQFKELWQNMKHITLPVFFSQPMIVLLIIIGVFNLFLWKKIPLFAYLANLCIIVGSGFYFILWAPLMGIHDYYYSALLILFVGVFIPFVWFIKGRFPNVFKGYALKIAMVLFLAYNFWYCLNVVQLKTVATKGDYAIVANKKFVSLMHWTNWDVDYHGKRYERMRPYMKQLGIKPQDKIISLPDPSFNITLFLTRHKGWTDFSQYHNSADIDTLITKGAKYLLIGDTTMLKQQFLSPFLNDKIGDFHGVDIYKLSMSEIR